MLRSADIILGQHGDNLMHVDTCYPPVLAFFDGNTQNGSGRSSNVMTIVDLSMGGARKTLGFSDQEPK